MLRTVEFKLYPTEAQADTLSAWMRRACWVYNRALEHRVKAYKRRKEPQSFVSQCRLLTQWRQRMPGLQACPICFSRDALRRVDRGMQAFFRRVKAGERPGFPRFRSSRRYNSLERLDGVSCFNGNRFIVPKLGGIKFNSGNQSLSGKVTLSRIIRRASGWFGQVLLDDGKQLPKPKPVESVVGIDVGLNSFATLSTGEKIDNPRFGRKSQTRLRIAQRAISRCQRGSKRRYRAIRRLRLVHERVAAQRKAFTHRHSTAIVRRFDLIGYEDLSIGGMVKNHRLAASIMDAAWGTFTRQIVYKAAYAGKHSFAVKPHRTSQECPWCGAVVPKDLSERRHQCSCKPGVILDRDEASGLVIEARAVGLAAASGVEVRASAERNSRSVSGTDETRESRN